MYSTCRILYSGHVLDPGASSACIIEGSLEVKLPTIWTVGKAQVGRVREEKKSSEKIREERRCRCAKRWESRDSLCFFQRFVAQEGRKVGSLAGAESCGEMRD